jgi:hypothetical protein
MKAKSLQSWNYSPSYRFLRYSMVVHSWFLLNYYGPEGSAGQNLRMSTLAINRVKAERYAANQVKV